MKKIIALLLCITTLAAVFAGCAKIKQDAEDKGAEIPIYVSTEIYSLDPAFAYLDEAGVKLLGLMYDGLFIMNEKGVPEKALCKSYSTGTNREGDFYMEITLNDTKWSDGRSVSANDFVFAWKRILEPEFTSEAASLLFDVKNARDCKAGLISIDDLGVVASESQVLEITFERKIDVDAFIEILCSPALVPLREDKVGRLADWASYYATTVTNGPFYPKMFEPGTGMLELERSIYYYRDIESETQKLDVYVTPYRLNVYFVSQEKAYEMYQAGEIVYDSELPIAERANVDGVTLSDTMATATVALNNTVKPFDNADVRRALSLAIDREALANKMVFAKPAEGIVPEGVFDTTNKTSFREKGGALIEKNADLTEAKSLLQKAGVSGGTFTLKIRDNENDKAIAEYLKSAWEPLGFKITVETVTYEAYVSIDYPQYTDLLAKAYREGDFEAILIDSQALSTQPFQMLAAFAKDFSGTAMDLSGVGVDDVTTELPIRDAPVTETEEAAPSADPMAPVTSAPVVDTVEPETTEPETTEPETTEPVTEPVTDDTAPVETAPVDTTAAPAPEPSDDERVFETVPHVTGYNNSEYNELIEKAFAETDASKRAELLHQAEELLVGDMPVIPLFVYQDAYVHSSDLKTIGSYYLPFRNFKKTTLKNYEHFKEGYSEEEESGDED